MAQVQKSKAKDDTRPEDLQEERREEERGLVGQVNLDKAPSKSPGLIDMSGSLGKSTQTEETVTRRTNSKPLTIRHLVPHYLPDHRKRNVLVMLNWICCLQGRFCLMLRTNDPPVQF